MTIQGINSPRAAASCSAAKVSRNMWPKSGSLPNQTAWPRTGPNMAAASRGRRCALRRMVKVVLNDPLDLRTPPGVTPERALDLAPRIANILQGVRLVLSAAKPFDPATSTRRFRIGPRIRRMPCMARPLLKRRHAKRRASACRFCIGSPASGCLQATALLPMFWHGWTKAALPFRLSRSLRTRRFRPGFLSVRLAVTGWWPSAGLTTPSPAPLRWKAHARPGIWSCR